MSSLLSFTDRTARFSTPRNISEFATVRALLSRIKITRDFGPWKAFGWIVWIWFDCRSSVLKAHNPWNVCAWSSVRLLNESAKAVRLRMDWKVPASTEAMKLSFMSSTGKELRSANVVMLSLCNSPLKKRRSEREAKPNHAPSSIVFSGLDARFNVFRAWSELKAFVLTTEIKFSLSRNTVSRTRPPNAFVWRTRSWLLNNWSIFSADKPTQAPGSIVVILLLCNSRVSRDTRWWNISLDITEILFQLNLNDWREVNPAKALSGSEVTRFQPRSNLSSCERPKKTPSCMTFILLFLRYSCKSSVESRRKALGNSLTSEALRWNLFREYRWRNECRLICNPLAYTRSRYCKCTSPNQVSGSIREIKWVDLQYSDSFIHWTRCEKVNAHNTLVVPQCPWILTWVASEGMVQGRKSSWSVKNLLLKKTPADSERPIAAK